jgi:hypothetical protein
MDNRPQHDELRGELARRGLPRAYIERLVAELDDHFTDLLEERSTSMGAARKLQPEADNALTHNAERRLGEPTRLAIFAAEQYRARSFLGRHPLVTFAFIPLPLLAASVIFFSFAMGVLVYGLNLLLNDFLNVGALEPADHLLLGGIVLGFGSWYILVVPPTAAGLLLCRIYRRNAVNWRWPVIGCAIIAVVAACATHSYEINSEEQSSFSVGLNAAWSIGWFFTTWLPKFAVAMGIGLLLVKRAQQKMAAGGGDVVAIE